MKEFVLMLISEASNTATIISALTGLGSFITVIFQLIKKICIYFKTNRYINKLLLFKNKQCYISLSVFKTKDYHWDYDAITLTGILSYQNLTQLMNNIKCTVLPFAEKYDGNNIIHIGGPLTNKNVNSLLSTKYTNFLYYTPRNEEGKHELNNVNRTCIVYTDDNSQGFMIGLTRLSFDDCSEYGIFIRIPACKKERIEYTTHIIFAGDDLGTQKAVEIFTQKYKLIAKKYNKQKYCFAIKLSKLTETIEQIGLTDILDLTDDFFGITNVSNNP